MQKRYQVFVSSTFQDLKDERAEVMQALLELDCMPAGMELFPAASDEQWSWIKRVIDESDYYIVILGGRYGTVHPKTKQSFTEMEYRYAVESKTPVIAFLHQEPEEIALSKSEKDEAKKAKLEDFRKLCEQQLCKYWTSASDLGAKVSRSITQLQKYEPAVGWVRANDMQTSEAGEVQRLKKVIEDLEGKLKAISEYSDKDITDLNLDKKIILSFNAGFQKSKKNKAGRTYWVDAGDEWFEIEAKLEIVVKILAHDLLIGPPKGDLVEVLNSNAWHNAREEFADKLKDDKYKILSVRIDTETVKEIRSQLVGMDLIEVEIADRQEIWHPTNKGHEYFFSLVAAKPD